MAKTDAELVGEALNGDPQAFEEIVRRYQRLIFNIVYHYLGRRNDVEDLAQEVFLRLFSSLGSFDSGRPLQPWIARIAVNCCLDELRRPSKRRTVLFSDLDKEEEGKVQFFFERFSGPEGLTTEEADECFRLLQKLMEKLNKKDKMAFVLREVEGLSYSEVAKSLGTSELGARIRVSRSRKKLQQEMHKILQRSKGVKQ